MRGFFLRDDGVVLPNNVTRHGVNTLLKTALRDESASLYAGLVKAVPDYDLEAGDLQEPTIGVNGYARINIPRSALGWPGEGYVNDELYLETGFLTWAATGAGFNKPINRLAIFTSPSLVVGSVVVALSVSLPADVTILSTTPLEQRRFKYRLFAR